MVSANSLLLLLMTLPAFGTYFFAENFLYLGEYRANGERYWATVFAPSDHIFFRPVFCAVSLLWNFVLPLDPVAYHVRNYAFSVINLLLLHRVLVRMVATRWARVLGLSFFAVSKIHLTTIGYINIYDSIMMSMLMLSTILFFLRYAAAKRPLDYGLGLLFCFLSIFSKDYGLAVVVVVMALAAGEVKKAADWKSETRWWAVRLSPLVVMILLYLGLRLMIVGLPPKDNPVYSPELSVRVSARNTLEFTTAMWNLSLTRNEGAMGVSGLGTWLAKRVPESGIDAFWLDLGLYVSAMGLLVFTVVVTRTSGWALLMSLAWIAAYLTPTFLTRNFQVYYFYEPILGLVTLLALGLRGASRRLLIVWTALLLLTCANGFISNYASYYAWQHTAKEVERIRDGLQDAQLRGEIQSIVLVTARRGFFNWALTAGSKVPDILELIGPSGVRMDVISRDQLQLRRAVAEEGSRFFDIDKGFREIQPSSEDSVPEARFTPSGERVKAMIIADPNPIQDCEGTGYGVTTLSWAATGPTRIEIHVGDPDGPLLGRTGPSGSGTTGHWVSDGMVFYMQDVSKGRPLTSENTLASVTVRLTTKGCQ